MISYQFYATIYSGNSIAESEWPVMENRASEILSRYKRIYTVTEPEEDAEAKAVCAIADAVYFYDGVANGYASSSIGSVSTSGSNVDTSPKAQQKEFYRCACLYLDIYRGA